MSSKTILTILPSGIHEPVEVHPNFISEIEDNKKLFNAIIGPLLNKNDLESGFKYYVYCKITDQDIGGKNFFMTDIIQKVYPDVYIIGQIYIIKKVEQDNIVDIEDKEIGNIFDLLCHLGDQNIKIKRFRLKNSINEKEIINKSYDPFYNLCSWICL